jgi:hypothetical protein
VRARWPVLFAVGFGALFVFVLVAGFVATGDSLLMVAAEAGAATCQTAPDPTPGPPGAVSGQLDDEQVRNATAIVATGKAMQVPERGWVIAVATAMQESGLRNVRHGDLAGPDSTGLFQQRDGWGPREVREDPAGAARLFYTALLKVTGWDHLPLYVAAQAVQHSAFPSLYAQHEEAAARVVRDLAGVTAPSPSCTTVVAAGGWALPLPAGRVHAPTAEHHDYPAVDLPLSPAETQPVFAVAAGIAAPMEEPAGCGHGVTVQGDTGEWLYCHLSAQLVVAGQRVGSGDQIGVSGWSGHVDPPGPGGAHLHLQLRRNGRLTCLQPVLDALAAGGVPPDLGRLPQPAANTCLRDWAAQGSH